MCGAVWWAHTRHVCQSCFLVLVNGRLQHLETAATYKMIRPHNLELKNKKKNSSKNGCRYGGSENMACTVRWRALACIH